VERAGYVLVGGMSSRMGRDKALLPFRGGYLAAAVAREVAAAAGNVALVGNPRRHGRIGYGVVPDIYPGEGPLGGILTALQHSAADWNVVVACDMPGVSSRFLGCLLDFAQASEVDALLPAGPSRRVEPLCAVYHRRARQTLYAAFQHGVRQVAAALEGLRAAVFLAAEATPFQNVNTPADWVLHGAD
jgi:molybdenum cofactor guanylyltransferase